jgi:hypothetical protein
MQYGTLEEEIIRARGNKILNNYLMDTAQYFYSTGDGIKFSSINEKGTKYASQGGLISDPSPLHPAQNAQL